MHPLAPSLDTLGFFVRELADVPLVSAALAGAAPLPLPHPQRRPVFGFCKTDLWERVEPSTRQAIEAAAAKLELSGAEVREVALPASFKGLLEAQVAIMGAETAVSLRRELEDSPGELSARLRETLEAGRAVSAEQLAAARAQAGVCRRELDQLLAPLDALLTLAVAGEAPVGLDSTGDPAFCRIWTLLGTACASLPVLRGPAGLPVGLQLVGRRGGDEALLGAAAFALSALEHGVGADGFEPS